MTVVGPENPIDEPGGQPGSQPNSNTVPYEPGDSSQAIGGRSIGRFTLERFHAAGGLGEVYVAHDTELDRRVALKRIRFQKSNHAANLRRFMIEAEVTAYLEHPGVVPIHGLVKDEAGEPAYAMRFIKGKTLKEAIREFHGGQASVKLNSTPPAESDSADDVLSGATGAASVRRSATLLALLQRFVAVCNTIAYSHQKGVIHRDIKPSNIMFGEFGETWVVDWGLAKRLPLPNNASDDLTSGSFSLETTDDINYPEQAESDSTAQGKPMGTIQFMSPEQAAGQWDIVSELSDIYSLGATLYVILTGRVPFVGGSLPEIKKKIRKGDFATPRSVNSTISPALDSICRKAMARDQDQRYPSAKGLASDIECWMADEPVSCYRDSITTRLTRWARRNRTLATSLVASGVITLVAVSVIAAMLAGANAREREASKQIVQAYGKAKTVIDQNLLDVAGSDELRQFDLVDLRRRLLESAIPFYEWLGQKSPLQSGFEVERAKTMLSLAELNGWLDKLAKSEDNASESLKLLETAKRIRPDDLSIVRLEVKAFNQLLAVRRSEMDFREVDNYLGLAKSAFERLLPSGNVQDKIDWLNFQLVEAEYLEVANRHSESVELLEAAVQSNLPDGLSTTQEKQWNGVLARLYYQLGQEHRQFRRLAKAQAACEQAIKLSTLLAHEQLNDGAAQHRLANSYYLLGQIQSSKQQTAEALASFEKCERIESELARNRPSIPSYRLLLAWALHNQASLLSGTDRLKESNEILLRAHAIVDRLRLESPKPTESYRLHLMLLDRSAMNAQRAKDDKLAKQLFQEALQGYKEILDEKPEAWESRLGQGWILLKLGDMCKNANGLPEAADYYLQVIKSTDMLHGNLRDQASASELNFNAGYALFDVLTRMDKFDDASSMAEKQSSKYTENMSFFSILGWQCQCRKGKLQEVIERLRTLKAASSMRPTEQFEIARTHYLVASHIGDLQQKADHISLTLDWLKNAFEAGGGQKWIFDSDSYFPLLVAESRFQELKERFGRR